MRFTSPPPPTHTHTILTLVIYECFVSGMLEQHGKKGASVGADVMFLIIYIALRLLKFGSGSDKQRRTFLTFLNMFLRQTHSGSCLPSLHQLLVRVSRNSPTVS